MVGNHGLFIETDFFGIQIQNPDNSPSAFSEYGYLMKLDTSATPTWVKTVGSVQMNETIRDVYVDGNSIYTLGRSEDHFAATPTGGDFFIKVRAQSGTGAYLGAYWRGNKTFAQRWDMDGNVNWGKVMHGNHQTHSAHGLSIYGNATNIAIGGIFSNTITFDGTDSRTSAGSYDGFLTVYDATDGSYMNTFTYGTSSDDRIYAVALIGEDVYSGGWFYSTIDQDFSASSSSITSLGSKDGLLQKHTINNPVACVQTAPVVTGFTNLSHHGTTISWNPTDIPTGGKFVVRYHKFGDSPNFSWKNVSNVNAASAYINGLDASQRYVFRVGAACAGQNATYSDTMSVVTKAYCPQPTNPITAPTVANATVSWDDMGADSYKVRYREVGGNWHHRNTISTSVMLNSLMAGTNYEWQVRAICNGGGNKAYIALQSFSTPSVRLSGNADVAINGLRTYPNPTSNLINVEFETLTEGQVTIEIIDMSGRVVIAKTLTSAEGINRISVGMAELPKGVYQLRVFNKDRQSIVMERVIKQ